MGPRGEVVGRGVARRPSAGQTAGRPNGRTGSPPISPGAKRRGQVTRIQRGARGPPGQQARASAQQRYIFSTTHVTHRAYCEVTWNSKQIGPCCTGAPGPSPPAQRTPVRPELDMIVQKHGLARAARVGAGRGGGRELASGGRGSRQVVATCKPCASSAAPRGAQTRRQVDASAQQNSIFSPS